MLAAMAELRYTQLRTQVCAVGSRQMGSGHFAMLWVQGGSVWSVAGTAIAAGR